MPGSSPEGKKESAELIKQYVAPFEFKRVLDIGPGRGTYAVDPMFVDIWDEHDVVLDCIEIWPEYINTFNLQKIYELVICQDVRCLHTNLLPEYDLVILGDVIEHMSLDTGVSVFKNLLLSSRYVLISTPSVTPYHQQETEYSTNPHEEHHYNQLLPSEVIENFGDPIAMWTGEMIGVFLYKGFQ